jgi:hypothetical protein
MATAAVTYLLANPLVAAAAPCVDCHREQSPALVMEWERSLHAAKDVGCEDCHVAERGDVDAWKHAGEWISTLVTPLDCARCHEAEVSQFSGSRHARGADILAVPDMARAKEIDHVPGGAAVAASGCWQCHGSVVRFERDAQGQVHRSGGTEDGRPIIDPQTWPNSGIGRMNPDGSTGSCHACHTRHAFDTVQSRSPESCGKCHRGADHPQVEIFNESKHGISFYVNRDRMALDRDDHWVLGLDYSAAPTCATCHVSSYLVPDGAFAGLTHDVGERLSWDLLSTVSRKRNLVVYEDGSREDYLEPRELPEVGDSVETVETYVRDGVMATRTVRRKVENIVTWAERRDRMKGACVNCHGRSHTDAFYKQFDESVVVYNERFGEPAQELMDELAADGVLVPGAPFEHRVERVFRKLWHDDARRARLGVAMMAANASHEGMRAVAERFYVEFLPAVVDAAATQGSELEAKYAQKVRLLAAEEHQWMTVPASEGSAESR